MGSLKSRLGRIKWFRAGMPAAWAYAGLLALWWGLHVAFGDRIWWVALVSLFAPYLFVPLVLLAPLGLIRPRFRYWAAILLSVLIFTLAYGPPVAVRAAEPVESMDELTILTFNILGYYDAEETVRAIVSEGTPDVVALQELTPALARRLVDELGETYPHRLLEPLEGSQGRGVLSRYPMVPARPSGAPAVDPFCQVVEIDVEGRTLTLYNAHLSVTEVWNYLGPGASFGEGIRGSFETREQQAQRILEDVDRRQEPVMVVGDFNMTPQTDAYRALARRLKDAHREAGRGFGHTFPAHGGRFLGIPYPRRVVRIDLILYSPDWVAQEARVLREHGRSDHMPVLARLAWSQ